MINLENSGLLKQNSERNTILFNTDDLFSIERLVIGFNGKSTTV
jgi:hypothetical protein